MMWAAAIRNIQERCIRFLPGLNASLQKQYQKAKQVDSIEDFAYVKESHVIQAAHDVGLFDKNQKEALNDCLDIRNRCGHPSKYAIGSQKVVAYLEEIIRLLYS